MQVWTSNASIKPWFAPPRWLLVALGLIPLMRLIYLGAHDELTANPIEFITRSTGTWALVFLCITLSVSPLRKLLSWPWIIGYRRYLGLLCFAYACLHFLIWFYLDHQLDSLEMLKDVGKRPFILMGFISFLMLIPLAMTSNKWSMQKLGRQWSTLHRLIYLISITVILHYFWHKAGKNDYTTPTIYASILAVLLLWRLKR